MSAVYRVGGDAKGALAVVALLIVLCEAITDSAAIIALMVLAVMLVAYAMTRVPMRHSMLGLMFCALIMPNPNEGFVWQPWVAPFQVVGTLLQAHWNTLDRSLSWTSPGVFSGLDLFFLTLGFVAYMRMRPRSKLDYAGAVPSPQPLKKLARISLQSTLIVWVGGLVRGGDFSMSLWQVNSVVYLPIIFLLFQIGIRGPQDFPAVFKIMCAAAVYRSLFATYVINAFPQPMDDLGNTKLPYGSSHGDSMLFADVFVLVGVAVLERVLRKHKWRVFAIVPVVVLGMISNNRRLVWVHIAVSVFVLYLITADNPLKRSIRRFVYRAAPVALLYIMVGWSSEYGAFFKPVRLLRSVVDAKADRSGSSFWREIENYNLVQTLLHNPLFGAGYGHGFDEIIFLPAVAYPLERYCPHNSILGLWAFCGYFGYAALTMLWVAAIYYAMRAYRVSQDPMIRAGSLGSIVCMLVYVMHCWGDLGLSTWTGVFIAGAAMAVAAKASEAAGANAPVVAARPRVA